MIYHLGLAQQNSVAYLFLNMEYCKTARGAEQLLYEGYRYQVNRRGQNGRTFWRCHNRNCPGRLSVKEDTVCSSTDHSHPPEGTANKVIKMTSTLKDKCMERTDTIPKLYNDMLLKVAGQEENDMAAAVPTWPSMKSKLYRSRQKTIPKLPTSRDDITLEGEWTETITKDRFLLRCDGEGEEKMIILATDKMLQRISEASTLYMDGTFATCPRLFYQLFTINIIVEGQQYPALYALLPSKRRTVYNRLFTLIKEEMQTRGFDLQPPRILSDFESGLIPAVQLHFPGASIAGCYFHFHQSLYRWVLTNGHATDYKENEQFYNFVRSAAALAFVPVARVRIAWFGLKSSVEDCAITAAFAAYFSATWMQGFPLAMWNHYETTDERTNNSLEGWHNRLNRLAGRDHPNMWQLLRLLQKEEAVSEVKIVQLENGGLPVKKRPTWVKLDRRINRLKEKFATISIEDYLGRMARLTGL